MVNRRESLLAQRGVTQLLLPIRYGPDDVVTTEIPGEHLSVPCDQSRQFEVLVEALRRKGLDAHGCFDCRYFHQPGEMGDVESTLGYCLEGKEGHRVQIGPDSTTKGASCDAYSYGSDEDRIVVAKAWAAAYPR